MSSSEKQSVALVSVLASAVLAAAQAGGGRLHRLARHPVGGDPQRHRSRRHHHHLFRHPLGRPARRRRAPLRPRQDRERRGPGRDRPALPHHGLGELGGDPPPDGRRTTTRSRSPGGPSPSSRARSSSTTTGCGRCSRVAKKTGSEALEADALHFSSDMWSSLVVLGGLGAVWAGIPAADSIAALVVSVFIAYAGWRLGARTLNTLLDTAPAGATEVGARAGERRPRRAGDQVDQAQARGRHHVHLDRGGGGPHHAHRRDRPDQGRDLQGGARTASPMPTSR